MSDLLEHIRESLPDRYRPVREIGRGGMAVVFLAEDRRHNNRDVALKVLDPGRFDSHHAQRFTREIGIAAGLTHPHIVPIRDSGVADNALYFVMPHIQGQSLRDRIDASGSLEIAETIRIIDDVGRALQYAHGEGIIHRDIKPANVLLTSGEALVTDFGIAAMIEAEAETRLTTPGTSLGTLDYMSPEQVTGVETLDGRTDIYALGCVAFEMLTGKPPYTGKGAPALMAGHLYGSIPSVRDARPEVSDEVAASIEKALAKDPEDRQQSMREFLAEINPSSTGTQTAVGQMRRAPTPRSKQGRLAAAVATAALAIAAMVFWPREPAAGEALLVLPFATATSSDAEVSQAAEVAEELIGSLSSWEETEVVPRVALAGPMFDMEISGPTIMDIADARRLAEAFRAQAFVAVTVDTDADTAVVEANLFPMAGGRFERRTIQARGAPSDLRALSDSVASALLELDRLGTSLEELRRHSSHPTALHQDAEGQRALDEWRLADAEAHFRNAVASDSTFALAQLRLGQTLYWQAATTSSPFRRAGPEIAQAVAAAARHSVGLTQHDSLHIRAFYSFQAGDYAEARATYQHLIDERPSDVYDWLMLGSTEFWDRWLTPDGQGALVPRSNLNAAIRAFEEAVRLQPNFPLGYGHLFDIHRWIAETAYQDQCWGFEQPRNEFFPPGRSGDPDQMIAFCPVVEDSVVWILKDRLNTMEKGRYQTAADALFDSALGTLSRWAAYDPTQARPHRERAQILIERRAALRIASPSDHRALALGAIESLHVALGLEGEPIPDDLIQLASLHLAADQPDSAWAVVQGALKDIQAETPRTAAQAATVLLATGRAREALTTLARPWRRWFIDNATGDGLIDYSGAEILIDRAMILGLTGQADSLVAVLDAFERVWGETTLGPEDVQYLWNDAGVRLVAPMASVTGGLDQLRNRVASEEPYWLALTGQLAPEQATALLAEPDSWPEGVELSSHLASAMVLWHSGSPDLALGLLNRIDSIPLSVGSGFEASWGLRARSLYERGRILEEAGDPVRASAMYQRFLAWWGNGDALTDSLISDTQFRLSHLR